MATQEFTPEITQDFYNRLAGNIRQRGERAKGLARSEALARGLTGDPFEGAAVGRARAETSRAEGDLEADIGYRVAGLQRDERLGREQREDTQAFQSGESDKMRGFQERMALQGMEFEREKEKTAHRRTYQNALWSAGAKLLGGAIGGFAAG